MADSSIEIGSAAATILKSVTYFCAETPSARAILPWLATSPAANNSAITTSRCFWKRRTFLGSGSMWRK
jgi:hypothetical protein